MENEKTQLVMPGEKLGAEEEFSPGSNTYAENGHVYSAVIGVPYAKEGKMNVKSASREIRRIGRDMLVIGRVVESMKNIMFVKIDNIQVDNKEYIAIKDGKILVERPRGRFGGGGGRFDRGRGGFGRDGREERAGGFRGRDRDGPREVPDKLAGIGDTVLARVIYSDKDSYTLTLDGRETGVIHARCEVCNGEVDLDRENNVLVCRDCKHREKRKISELYNKLEQIKKLFA